MSFRPVVIKQHLPGSQVNDGSFDATKANAEEGPAPLNVCNAAWPMWHLTAYPRGDCSCSLPTTAAKEDAFRRLVSRSYQSCLEAQSGDNSTFVPSQVR